MADIKIFRQTIISFPRNPNLDDITSGIESGSMVLDEVLCKEGFTVGECNANRFEATIHDIPDIEKQYIYVYQIVKASEDAPEVEVPLFRGRVDSCKRNRQRQDTSRHIIAYDALYYKGDTNIVRYWNNTFKETHEVSLKEFREGLCDYVGVAYDPRVVLPNDDLMIAKTQKIKGVSFIEMLKYICTLQACNANIGRNGLLQFISAFNTHDIIGQYEINTSDFESFLVPEFDHVVLDNSARDISVDIGEGTKILTIQNNLLILDKTEAELQIIGTEILNSVAKITYSPATIKMLVSDYSIAIGDIVHTEFGNSIVCEVEYTGPLLINQEISSRGKEDYDEQTTISGYKYSVTDEELKKDIRITKEQYYIYTNAVDLFCLDEHTTNIIDVRFTAEQPTIATFDAEILLDTESTITPVEYIIGRITYEINGAEVIGYHPTETWVEGEHILRLLYYIKIQSARAFRFIVKLNMDKGNATILKDHMQASIHGQGLMAVDEWDGYIDVYDTLSEIQLVTPTVVDNITEDVQIEVSVPTTSTITEIDMDAIQLVTPTVDDNMVEYAFVNKRMMSVYTHQQLQAFTHEDLNTGFIHG